LALQQRDLVAKLRGCHEALLEAEMRLVEAASDVEALEERNSGIAQQLEDERRFVAEVERESRIVKAAAEKSLEVCKVLLDGAEGHEEQYFRSLDQTLTMEDLEHEIEAEKSKLDYIHDGNAGALKEFELRQGTIEKLTEKIRDTARKLERLNLRISEVREKWEPELDKLIREISDAFAYNFEQIGCAGEVGVHKDEDFDLWSIEIKVKFRYVSRVPVVSRSIS